MYRKGGMYLNNVVSIIACVFMVLSKPAHSYELLIVGRFFMGLACGTDVTFDRLGKNDVEFYSRLWFISRTDVHQ